MTWLAAGSQQYMIRDVLLGVYALAWLFVVAVTVWRTGTVPAELWAVLGVGAGALIAVFRTDDRLSRRKDNVEDSPR